MVSGVWQPDEFASLPKVGSKDTRKAYLIPVSFMVLGDTVEDAEKQLKRALRVGMSPYNLGIVNAEVGKRG